MMRLLQESLFSSYLAWYSSKLLSRPFTKWKAYEVGIIDENGDLIKKPGSVEEKKVWGLFERFIANIKQTIIRVTGPSQAAAILTTLALFKENAGSVAYEMFYAEVCKTVGYDVLKESSQWKGKKIKFKELFKEEK